MKISEMIRELQKVQKKVGDVEVIVKNGEGAEVSFDADDFYIDTDHADGSTTLLVDA